MFRGATLVNLDSKGRLTVPNRYRNLLVELAQGQLICTIDIHQPCLLLYPLPEWEIIEKKLAQLSALDPSERRVQRLLLGHASECDMDNNGRILLAATLRIHAELEKEVMLVGQYNKFEIWAKSRWYQQVQDDIEAEHNVRHLLSQKLQDLSL